MPKPRPTKFIETIVESFETPEFDRIPMQSAIVELARTVMLEARDDRHQHIEWRDGGGWYCYICELEHALFHRGFNVEELV